MKAKATYFVVYDAGLPVATARILPEGTGYHVQRVAVEKAYRKHGLGKMVLNAIIAYAREQNVAFLKLRAQLQAIGFIKHWAFSLTDQPGISRRRIPSSRNAITAYVTLCMI